MDQKPADKKKKRLAAKAKKEVKPIVQVKLLYQESSDDPVVMETDSYMLRKDDDVWVSESGHVFDCVNGEVGEILGRYINDEFIEAGVA
jgi:hypothetical protein